MYTVVFSISSKFSCISNFNTSQDALNTWGQGLGFNMYKLVEYSAYSQRSVNGNAFLFR